MEDMQALLALSRGIDRVTEFIGKSVMWLIFLAILVSAGNAVMRKAINWSSNSLLEAQWYLFGAAFLMASAYTLKQNEHIRIDIVYGMFSNRTRQRIDLFGHVFFLMPFVLIMTWMLVPYMLDAIRTGQGSANSGGLIIWPARAFLLAGFVLLVFQGISEIIKKVAIIRGLIDDPYPFVSAHEQAELEGAALAKEVAELEKLAGGDRK
jgi:TRAP-type mannitol/chloroaromatic compound transport system permease small subunit